ncbi:MAG: K(+)-transporting ATPase subunit C [Microbacterium ginsengisoli]|jgi:K+-transporting ATPase ATPase C chain|uniref:K(+)-transporting ATPase subunit C n=1 Tax=Microbacterium TaxID=33882 RepID=UPI0006F9F9C1|nr:MULTISPECIES: K(+)-transporting ATPase subunit C [unclassified Microbacterium]KQR92147.1 potassium transporter KtrA [Microbacterium sp. Leaf347]KQS05894.1 potassium transporter KtrA [Microbacterium sp. Leaf351]MBN9197761.1 K(+)-transporting ATPase subunit C [Microbacterium ginsengisoli]OJU79322.1 MAG: potassium-transporting ATPase subunit C [Microbacterium sp. 71-23]
MSTLSRTSLRTFGVAVRAMLVFTLILGIGYTAVVTAVGQLVFPWQANGSLVTDSSGQTVGSALIGQQFLDTEGNPSPRYFQPRPSAAGAGYDPTASGGSNLGPTNQKLVDAITGRRAAVAAFEGVDPSLVPADAITASGSGLDSDISVAYADLQVTRIARERGLSEQVVQQLVASKIEPRDLGYLGESRVNVLELNLALDALSH